jgi:hypothetical protein
MEIKQANQSILDIILQATGSLNGTMALLRANDFSITEELPSGTQIQVPEGIEITQDIVSYYTRKGIKPATGFEAEPMPPATIQGQILIINGLALTIGANAITID